MIQRILSKIMLCTKTIINLPLWSKLICHNYRPIPTGFFMTTSVPLKPVLKIKLNNLAQISWRDDLKEKIRTTAKGIVDEFPEAQAQVNEILAHGASYRKLLDKAYRAGLDQRESDALEMLCTEATTLGPQYGAQNLKTQWERGLCASDRNKESEERIKKGEPASSVRVRKGTYSKVTSLPRSYPEGLFAGCNIEDAPSGLHPNDLRCSMPSPKWTVLIDETGSCFQHGGQGKPGKLVALAIPEGNQQLPPLPPSWHAIKMNLEEIDRIVQRVLDADCGVLGLCIDSLPPLEGELWVAGLCELMDWTLRLLPIDGPCEIHFLIEQRSIHSAGMDWSALAEDAILRLYKAFPVRGRSIKPTIQLICKEDHPYNGYVDAIAFSWGSNNSASRARLRQTGWLGCCLLDIPSREMQHAWDAYERGVQLEPRTWSEWVSRSDAQNNQGLLAHFLDCVGGEARLNPKLWRAYMEETLRHAQGKAIRLSPLGAQVDWLSRYRPAQAELPPPLQLMWHTLSLARANHQGEVDHPQEREIRSLAQALYQEDAPLVCQADLHLAVACTNRFDFSRSLHFLKRWEEIEPAIPGLRLWGQAQSSLGQMAAFRNQPKLAVEYFDKALEAFARLSDGGRGDQLQTGTYRVIAMMDDPDCCDAKVQEALMDLIGPLEEAISRLAVSESPAEKYLHHLLLRWLVHRPQSQWQNLYLKNKGQWRSNDGHPWPLIHLYRGILLREQDAGSALGCALAASVLGLESGQGAAVRLIGALCRTVATQWGEPWPEASEVFEDLDDSLFMAKDRIDVLRSNLSKTNTDLIWIRLVLPFNFR